MSPVDEHWIPFVPVHIVHMENNSREIQLQRAALPRIIAGDEDLPRRIEPRTGLLREGLETRPKHVYYVHDEEVSGAGTRVYQTYQRTRWY